MVNLPDSEVGLLGKESKRCVAGFCEIMEAVVVSVLVPQLGEEVGPSVQRHRVQVELEDTQDPAFHKTNFVN